MEATTCHITRLQREMNKLISCKECFLEVTKEVYKLSVELDEVILQYYREDKEKASA